MLRTILLAATALAPLPALAQQADPPLQDDAVHAEADEEIIITAPFRRNQVDVLSGTSVVSGLELTRDIRPSIGDTLARQPGVSASSFGPSVSRPVLRGFQGDRVRILTDGIGSIDASTASADHAPVINPLTAERIEVLRGPAALLFGSSAIGGVVNVIDSRIARRMPESPLHLDGIATYGSAAEERSGSASLDVPIGGKIVAHADGSYTKTGNLRTGGYLLAPELRAIAAGSDEAEVRENAERRGTLDNSAAETWEVAGGLSVVTDRGHLGFSVSHYESLYGIPPRLEFQHEEGEDHDHGDGEENDHEEEGHAHEEVRLDLRQTRLDIRGEIETGGGFLDRIRLRLGAADYRHDEIEPTGEIGTTFTNQGYEGRLELVQAQRGNWQGAIGGQFFLRRFEAVGEEKFVPLNNTEQFGLFTLQAFDLGPFKAEAGARYEKTNVSASADADLGNPDLDRSFDAFSGSIGASYAIADGIRIGLNGSRSERAPSAEELFANGPHAGTQAFEIGDPDFAKESSWGLEATLKGGSDAFSFAAAAYYNWFDNYIYQSATGEEADELPVFVYAQSDAKIYGFEVEAAANLIRGDAFTLRADALGDYVHADIDSAGPAPRIPPLRVLGGLEGTLTQFTARAEVEHVFEQDRVSDFELPTDGYTMVNASLAFRPFGRDNATSLVLSANNLFDVEARRHASFLKDFAPLAGRDIRVTARFQL
ncbi:TonB-dependent receptor [Sphingomonas japonica]|uniref:Iron complex outermembrane receptor protein n=1 Tax=Sphingomonas japonica TaxID=511662 RepID=A0ABX0U1C1_9SPHN|nr:TonB-dependent receptor [Sphingomonas japonica]NIJ23182.1 iron complex outermembrane receptor protein [Sphingomonas japonica]